MLPPETSCLLFMTLFGLAMSTILYGIENAQRNFLFDQRIMKSCSKYSCLLRKLSTSICYRLEMCFSFMNHQSSSLFFLLLRLQMAPPQRPWTSYANATRFPCSNCWVPFWMVWVKCVGILGESGKCFLHSFLHFSAFFFCFGRNRFLFPEFS